MDQRPPSPANRLERQNSPYLRQHAHNPVDWWPWCPEALALARSSGRPILLSIGYSACHWCHVMAHESFEDEAVAALMNRLFVNIKVDREERPDLDRIYQLAHQMLTGRGGGWPLTMFLMHDDQRPFFGGTYFPRSARFGLPAFSQLLQQVSDYYHAHLEELREPAAQIVAALQDLNPPAGSAEPLSDAPLISARARLESSFDRDYGGFGAAPKFPHAPGLTWLLRVWYASAHDTVPDLQALYMASLTLTRMVEGGLFDQLGGGFFRYSVDERWEIPHFEKMLYDNAQLLAVLAEAAQATGEPLFSEAASRSADWMLRELGAGHGGTLSSSLDADSEGHEGRFYVWSREAVQSALNEQEWRLFEPRFGLDAQPNFEAQWHLCVHASLESLAAEQQMAVEQVSSMLQGAQAKLLALREQRVRPGLDDKVLGSWNALAIAALATAARCLKRPDYAAHAGAALERLRLTHWRDGRLLVSGAEGAAELPAYLDDYAYLCDAILELSGVRLRASELSWAVELAQLLLQHFEDRGDGGFYFTADDAETLISRPKSYGDEAIPSGNAVAARVLLRLGYLLGEPRYLASAERTLRAAWSAIEKYPHAHASMLLALQDYLTPPAIVILRGERTAVESWQSQLNAVYAPRRWTLAAPEDLSDLPSAIAGKPAAGPACAYVCRGTQCTAAITSLEQLWQELDPDSSS